MKAIKFFLVMLIAIVIIMIFKGFSFFVLYALGIAWFLFTKIKKNDTSTTITSTNSVVNNVSKPNVIIKCAKCSAELSVNDKFCGNCGAAFDGNNVTIEEGTPTIPVFVTAANYDSILSLSENEAVKQLIEREIKKTGLDLNTNLIPQDLYKRKKILNIIFCALVFIYVGMIFFHFPLITYFIGLIILLIMFFKTKSYNLEAFITKQIKARPDEKVSNIIMNIKNTLVVNNLNKIKVIGSIIAIVLPLIIFFKPVIIYEQNGNNYGVRYYIYGLTNFTSVNIPEKHNGKDVVSLRGNAFSNMYLLKKAVLPNTITEIRGQAFKNDYSLKEVSLPKNLTYLGGESFYNCISLKKINLPVGLTEIKGSTFENCSNLESITIPDNVTRIGGHAFYGNSSLNMVNISKNSKLTEIGSSAFRMCSKLEKIYIPQGVYVNERAFKESPTRVYEYGSSKLEYDYHTYLYINKGYKKSINEYRKSAIIQDSYIELVEVTRENGYSIFSVRYTSNTETKDFVLSYYDRKKQINENLVIEITNDYVFNYYDRISLDVYYN